LAHFGAITSIANRSRFDFDCYRRHG
jgi:hypothetical protein